jgi:hypothetical protein
MYVTICTVFYNLLKLYLNNINEFKTYLYSIIDENNVKIIK